MALNCKQGDLARVVSTAEGGRYYGFIVRCVEPTVSNKGRPGWIVEPQLGSWRGVQDSAMRPIRDPGEDAKDETLLWLPVPEKVTA